MEGYPVEPKQEQMPAAFAWTSHKSMEGVLKPLCDVTDAKLDARTHVEYTADQAEAVRLARAGRYQAAFLIAPTTLDELQAIVRGGEVLPQKSTHFYPKLYVA